MALGIGRRFEGAQGRTEGTSRKRLTHLQGSSPGLNTFLIIQEVPYSPCFDNCHICQETFFSPFKILGFSDEGVEVDIFVVRQVSLAPSR